MKLHFVFFTSIFSILINLNAEKYTTKLYDNGEQNGFWKMVGVSGLWDQTDTESPQELTDYKINDNDTEGVYGIYENGGIAINSSSKPNQLVKLTAKGDLYRAVIKNINTSNLFIQNTLSIGDIVAGHEVAQVWRTMYIKSPFHNGSPDILIQYDTSLEGKSFAFYVENQENEVSSLYTLTFSTQYNSSVNSATGTISTESIYDSKYSNSLEIIKAFDIDLNDPIFNPLTSNDELIVYSFDSVENFWPLFNSKNSLSTSNDFNELEAGKGYWMKFNAETPYRQGGLVGYTNGLNINNSTYFSSIIQDGWNLLTLPESPVISTPNGYIIKYVPTAGKYSTLLVSDKTGLEQVSIDISGDDSLTELVIKINGELKANSYLKKVKAFPVKFYESSVEKTGILLLAPFLFNVSDEKMKIINDSGLNYFSPFETGDDETSRSWKIQIGSPFNSNDIFTFNFDFDSNNDGTKNLSMSSSFEFVGNSDKFEFFSEVQTALEAIAFDSANNIIVDTRNVAGTYEKLFDISYNMYSDELLISLKNTDYNTRFTFQTADIFTTNTNYSDAILGEVRDLVMSDNFNLSDNLVSKYDSDDFNNTRHIFSIGVNPNIDLINETQITETAFSIDEVEFTLKESSDVNISKSDFLSHLTTQLTAIDGFSFLIDTDLNTSDSSIFDDENDLIFITSSENFSFENLFYFKTYQYDTDSNYDSIITASTTAEQLTIPAGSTLTETTTLLKNNIDDIDFVELSNEQILAYSKSQLYSLVQTQSDDYIYSILPTAILLPITNSSDSNLFSGYLHLSDFLNKSTFYFDENYEMNLFVFPELEKVSNFQIDTTNTIQNSILTFLTSISDDLKPIEVISSTIYPTSIDDDNDDAVTWERIPLEILPSTWNNESATSQSLYSNLFYVRRDKAYWIKFSSTEETNFKTALEIDEENTYMNKYVNHRYDINGNLINLFQVKIVVALNNVKDIASVRGYADIGNNRVPLNVIQDLEYLEGYIRFEEMTEDISDVSKINVTVFDSFGEEDTYSIDINFEKPNTPTGEITYISSNSYSVSLDLTFSGLTSLDIFYINTSNILDEVEASNLSSYSLDLCEIGSETELKPYNLLFYGSDNETDNLANFSDIGSLIYVPLFYGTSKLTSSYMNEDILPTLFDTDCAISDIDTTNNGMAFLNQLNGTTLSIFYSPEVYSNDDMSSGNYSTSDSMFIAYNGTLFGRIKFSPIYRGYTFFVLNESTNEVFKGIFYNDIYTNDGNPFSLTKLN